MTLSFNLLDEPFLPVLFKDGTAGELSVSDALARAAEVAELRDASPLVTVALHRFLLAILHRVHNGPKTKRDRLAVRSAGTFDQAKLTAYFKKWHDRFDLFHPKYPFLQTAGFKTNEPSGINRLCQERSRGNNAALFDHTTDDPPPALTLNQVARILFADHAFALSGGNSATVNFAHAPLVAGAIVLVHGDNLFETLWLNWTILDPENSLPIVADDDDAPIWEREPKEPHTLSNVPYGYLDYLVWPSRTVHLVPEADANPVRVRQVYYAQGRRFAPSEAFYDPMIAYFRTKDKGDKPVRFNEFRDMWRDSAALFQFATDDDARGPNTLHMLREFTNAELPRAKTYSLSLYGMCMDSRQAAKVLFWRHESLPLRLEYLDDPTIVSLLKKALSLAEDIGGKEVLRAAAWAAASTRLSANDDSSPDKARVSSLVDAMAPERFYWSQLELPFREFLVALAQTSETDRQAVFDAWFLKTLEPLARQAFTRSVATIDAGRDLKAVMAGERVLNVRLSQIRKQHNIARPIARTKVGAS